MPSLHYTAYMALSAPCLKEVIKPEKLADYQCGLTGLCNDQYNSVGDRWLPRECFKTHAKYDKRVLGLLKTEYEGEQMIGLRSKTYIVSKTITSKATSALMTASRLTRKARKLRPKRLQYSARTTLECKFSSKGVSERLLKKPLNIF